MSDDEDNVVSLDEAKKQKLSMGGPKAAPVVVDKIESAEDAIAMLNRVYAEATINGKFCVINETVEDKISYMSKKDFSDSLAHLQVSLSSSDVNGNTKFKREPFTKLWSESNKKRWYNDLVFDPKKTFDRTDLNNHTYNTWRGFRTEPKEGDCSLTLLYIHDIISNNDEIIYNWILDFLAHMIQRPWEKPEIALVLIGMKGVGKTFFMQIIQTLIDGRGGKMRHSFKTSNPEDLFGTYRDHLQYKIALLMEEVTWGGDKKHEGQLNDYITSRTLTSQAKFNPVITASNLMRIVMGANHGWVVPASQDERRYMITTVSSAQQQKHSYFEAISDELKAGGYEAFMHYLSQRDISNFNYREAPNTDALADQKVATMSGVEAWWQNVLTKGQINIASNIGAFVCVGRDILYNSYCKDAKKLMSRQRLLRSDEFGIKLREFLPKVEDGRVVMNDDGRRIKNILEMKRIGKDNDRMYCHIMPPLAVCRELWDFRLKRKNYWDEPNEWELPEYGEI